MSVVLWILGITCVTLLGSWYTKRYNRSDLLIAMYVTFILVSQILAVKISEFDLGFGSFYAPSGILVFSITFLLTDIVNEKFGRKETHRMVFIAFITQVIMVAFFWLGDSLRPAPFWTMQDTWSEIFGFVPRVTVASWVSFLVSENLDAYIFSWFKKRTGGRHLWARNVFSSLPSLAIDTFIFIPLAFWGVASLWPLIMGQVLLKWLVGFINIPFMYINKSVLVSKNCMAQR